MRIELVESLEWIGVLDRVYMAKDGAISKRSIKRRQAGNVSVRAYCYLQKSNRAFKIDNFLACVPFTSSERTVV